jgi:hypothetical protein
MEQERARLSDLESPPAYNHPSDEHTRQGEQRFMNSGGRGGAARGRGSARGAARTASHGGSQRQGEQRPSFHVF